MIRIDHWWSSKANPPAPPFSPICLPFIAAMTNATSVICHKFLQQAATLSLPDGETPQSSVVALPRCDHTQMDPSYLWSGPVTEHTYKTAFHPLRLPVLSVLCPGRFYRLGWIYDCDAALALKPPLCDRAAASSLNGGIAIQPGMADIMEPPWLEGFLYADIDLLHTHVASHTHSPCLYPFPHAPILHPSWHDL